MNAIIAKLTTAATIITEITKTRLNETAPGSLMNSNTAPNYSSDSIVPISWVLINYILLLPLLINGRNVIEYKLIC